MGTTPVACVPSLLGALLKRPAPAHPFFGSTLGSIAAGVFLVGLPLSDFKESRNGRKTWDLRQAPTN